MTFEEFLSLLESNRPGQVFDVRLTADEWLTLAERQFGGETAGLVEDLTLALRPGEVVIGGRAGFHGLPLRVHLAGRPVLVDGRIRLEVSELTVNGKPAPAMLRNQLDRVLDGRLEPGRLGLELDLLEIEAGAMRLRGRTVARKSEPL
jgi:hypothetical protein